MKIAINRKYGGFNLSHKAVMRYAALKGFKLYSYEYDFKTQTCSPADESKIDDKRLLPIISYSTEPIKNQSPSNNNTHFSHNDIKRHDPILIQVIEELGKKANGGSVAQIKLVDIPDDVEYTIEEYDGIEWVAEKHRTWP